MKYTTLHMVLTAAVLFFAASGAYADKLIAFPVPFNPEKQALKLHYESGASVTGLISIEILDINGDHVYSRQYSTLSLFSWKGYNDSGMRVKAGMYILKARIEFADGSQKNECIRILVKR